ncbi:MAG: chloride channel protein [Lachnospiraceae bacterium]|nr:chloride channel protein [Lachnospiraceae bacterium]
MDEKSKNKMKHKIRHDAQRLIASIKWIIFSILTGLLIGTIGSAFYHCLQFVTKTRLHFSWLLLFLPLGGLLIVGLYQIFKDENDTGTNLVLSAIHSNERIPLRMAPLIFISTLITHLFGGSAGREGAALQIGGSIGGSLGRLFRFNEKDRHIMIMCGMSAAFTALFGTPMAAAIFSIEVVSVGIMHYSALVPCVISALVSSEVSSYFGVTADTFLLGTLPVFNLKSAGLIALLAILSALISILFCILLHQSEHLYKKFFKNRYLRVFAGGIFIVLLTLLIGNQDYNGSGITIIERCIHGESVNSFAFVLKMIFTAFTLGAGFKGGEIVPSFFVGATFGYLFSNFCGLSPALCTAVGMISVFCGVTNCPITSLLMSFELFGYEGMPFYLLAVALSYMLSGYYGLYLNQKIIYSKYKTEYINRKTH